MRIPKLNVRPQSREFIQEFGGLDRRPRISENCFSEMKNLTSDFYPALAPRPQRGIVGSIENCNALLAGEKLAWVSGNILYWGGEAVLELTAGESVPRQLVMMGACIVVFPDNLYYNTVDPEDKGVFRVTMDSAEDEFTFSLYYRNDPTRLPQEEQFAMFNEDSRYTLTGFAFKPRSAADPCYIYTKERIFYILPNGTAAYPQYKYIAGIPNPLYVCIDKHGNDMLPFAMYEVTAEFDSEEDNELYFVSNMAYAAVKNKGVSISGIITVTNKETGLSIKHRISEVFGTAVEDFETVNIAAGNWLQYHDDTVRLYVGGELQETVVRIDSPWFARMLPEVGAIGYDTEIELLVEKGDTFKIPYLQELSNGRIQACFQDGSLWISGTIHGGAKFTTTSGSFDPTKNYTASVSLATITPLMDYVIESQNRLWGCRYGLNHKGELVNEIYASALGDFRQWYLFAGVSTDSYVASVGHPGAFTGAINYRGYLLFFKENAMYKVYGDYPENYQIVTDTGMGVQKGCDKSLFVLSNVLYYKSPDGVFAYDGSSCQRIDAVLGNECYSNVVCGGVGTKLWLSMEGEQNGHSGIYTCDIDKGMWHKEDATAARFMARYGNDLYVLDSTGRFFTVKGSAGEIESGEISFVAETGVIGYSTPDSKYVSRFALRVSIPHDGSLQIFVEYDSANVWEFKGSIEGVGMQTFTVPVVPRRCDHFRIRLQGKGDCRIFGFSKVLEEGGAV